MQFDCSSANWGSPPAPCLHVAFMRRPRGAWPFPAREQLQAEFCDRAHLLLAVLLSPSSLSLPF